MISSEAAGERQAYFGWQVVSAAFVLAVFGWGIGFYGPSVFLRTLHEERGWPIALVSAAITTHFLFGALFVAYLPEAYARWGLTRVTQAGISCCTAIGAMLLGQRRGGLATVSNRGGQRSGLGGDDRRCDQRDRRAVVRQ
jgi:hypothetical protein